MSKGIRRGILAVAAVAAAGYYVHHKGWVEPSLAWLDKAMNGPLVFIGAASDSKPRTLAQVAGGEAASQEAMRIIVTPSQRENSTESDTPSISTSPPLVVTGIIVPRSAWMFRRAGVGPRIESLPAISLAGGGAASGGGRLANGTTTNPFSESLGNTIVPTNDMLPPRTVTAVPIRTRGSAVSYSTR